MDGSAIVSERCQHPTPSRLAASARFTNGVGDYFSWAWTDNQVLRNDHSGSITAGTSSVLATDAPAQAIAIGGFDGDTGLDLAFASMGEYFEGGNGPMPPALDRLWTNRLRQLHALLLSVICLSYELSIHFSGGVFSLVDLALALPLLSTVSGSTTVSPFGTFGLDTSLVGVDLFAQALDFRWRGEAHFTNVTHDRMVH